MNREIKFRGWSIFKNKWCYGSLLQSEIDVNELNVKCQIHERFANDFSIAKYDVIPESVSQFTSLKDKNGVEIYEGDILNCLKGNFKFGATERVEFNNGCFILRHRLLPISEFLNYDHDFEIEVIGNIYQNPDILGTVQK